MHHEVCVGFLRDAQPLVPNSCCIVGDQPTGSFPLRMHAPMRGSRYSAIRCTPPGGLSHLLRLHGIGPPGMRMPLGGACPARAHTSLRALERGMVCGVSACKRPGLTHLSRGISKKTARPNARGLTHPNLPVGVGMAYNKANGRRVSVNSTI